MTDLGLFVPDAPPPFIRCGWKVGWGKILLLSAQGRLVIVQTADDGWLFQNVRLGHIELDDR